MHFQIAPFSLFYKNQFTADTSDAFSNRSLLIVLQKPIYCRYFWCIFKSLPSHCFTKTNLLQILLMHFQIVPFSLFYKNQFTADTSDAFSNRSLLIVLQIRLFREIWNSGSNIADGCLLISTDRLFLYTLLTVHPDITSGRWPTWCTVFLYNTFILILYMFRANTCSSSGVQLY